MKKIFFALTCLFVYISSFAQTTTSFMITKKHLVRSSILIRKRFPQCQREPGPKYWQNRADYKINCTLNTDNHGVSGNVEITYTNNSPDNLKFLMVAVGSEYLQKRFRGQRQPHLEDAILIWGSLKVMLSNLFR
jgi:hypothetical protein